MMSELNHELHILRDENRKLRTSLEMSQKDEERYRSALVEIMRLSSSAPMINDIARKVLVGLDIEEGCPVGLTKYVQPPQYDFEHNTIELEGDDDE